MSAVLEPVLSLEPVEHIYRLGERVLPSVTGILAGAGIVDTQWFTETARWRGTAVHYACWYDDQNDLNESTLDPVLRPYVDAYRKFKAETQFEPTAIEQGVYNEALGYAGTPDRIGKMGAIQCVIDLKSGASSKVTRYQTVAYAACLPSPRKYVRMEVRLKPNGDFSLQVYEPKDYGRDFARWSAIVEVFHLKKELGHI